MNPQQQIKSVSKARKEHICCMCKNVIAVGTPYEAVTLFPWHPYSDSYKPQTYPYCKNCRIKHLDKESLC